VRGSPNLARRNPQTLEQLSDAAQSGEDRNWYRVGTLAPPRAALRSTRNHDSALGVMARIAEQVGQCAASCWRARAALGLDNDDFLLHVVQALWDIRQDADLTVPVLVKVFAIPRIPTTRDPRRSRRQGSRVSLDRCDGRRIQLHARHGGRNSETNRWPTYGPSHRQIRIDRSADSE
jgi:hypothetical protein